MKKITGKIAFLLTSGFLFCAHAFGQTAGNPENWCRNGLFPQESADYRIGKIKGGRGEKVYFFDDTVDDCPTNKNCRLKSYLIPGDEVIVSRIYKNFVCAWFQPQKGSETVGWLKIDHLEFVETPSDIALDDWPGKWKFYDNSIEIARAKTEPQLTITGSAVWRSLGDNIHVGELDTEAAPQKNLLKIGDVDPADDCRVTMRRVGRFLIVSDNLRCGGLNVTFTGVYQRMPER